MQQIKIRIQQKKTFYPERLLICNSKWCTIADVKITFPDDIDDEIEAIRELLADADKKLMRFDDT